jgi:type I restriction enzyme S subunit
MQRRVQEDVVAAGEVGAEAGAQFEQFMSNVSAGVANHVLRNRNLRTTRDLLLPKLISGELDVSAMPEPEALAA